MRIGFIIAEYNPLHNGHVKHILATKQELNCDKIVCIMSGDITQRGEFAIKDKYTRAEWAIKAGCDMVVELPVEYVLGSAQIFATGASKVIDLFDCEKYLSFGSECGSVYVLEKMVEMMTSDECQSYIKEFIEQGNNYARSSSLAFSKYLEMHQIDKSIANILDGPNNILGLEYIKAIKDMAVTPFTIKRDGNFNNSQDCNNPSAMTIRNQLINGNNNVINQVPIYVYNSLGKIPNISDKLFSIIKYEFSKKDNLNKIFGMNEGIHNRFLEYLTKSNSYQELINNVRTKRFTTTSLSRAILCALIDNTYSFEDVMDNDIEYLNILAIRSDAKDLLSIIETNLVTKPSELEKLTKVNSTLDKKSATLFKALNYEYESYMRIF